MPKEQGLHYRPDMEHPAPQREHPELLREHADPERERPPHEATESVRLEPVASLP